MSAARRVALVAALGALVAGLGCRGTSARAGWSPDAATGGTLQAAWRLRDSATVGRWSGPAEARWCEAAHRLVVLATRGDTGLGVLAVLPGALAPAEAPVADSTAPAPRSGVALRLPGVTMVAGFRAVGGQLRLTGAGATVSGEAEAGLAAPGTTDTVATLRLSFRRVPVTGGAAGCADGTGGQTVARGVP